MKRIFHLLITLIVSSTLSCTVFSNSHANNIITPEIKNHLEILVFAENRSNSNAVVTRNVDGELIFGQYTKKIIINNCYLNNFKRPKYLYEYPNLRTFYQKTDKKDHSVFQVTNLYNNLGISNANMSATNYIIDALKKFKNSEQIVEFSYLCSSDDQMDFFSKGYSNISLVPKYIFNMAKEYHVGIPETDENYYMYIGNITYDELKNYSIYFTAKQERDLKEKNDKKNKMNLEYRQLSESGSTEYMGSLRIGKYKQFYSIDYDKMTKEMIKVYVEDTKSNKKIKIYDYDYKYFKNLDDAYQFIKSRDFKVVCGTFIDYPKNIYRLKHALERDFKDSNYEFTLGELYSTHDLRNKYAKSLGYETYDEIGFMNKIGATTKQLLQLRSYKANTYAAYNKIINQMKKINYSSDFDIDTVLTYLSDKTIAQKSNISVNAQRDKRIKSAREETERAKRKHEEWLMGHIKNYPYQAIIQCSVSGQHTTAAACFTAEYTNTSLEIKNGNEYHMYKAHDLYQAGEENRDGLNIYLKSKFSIIAQNSNDTLVLSLIVIDRKTGKILYQKSAAKFGTVAFSK